MTIITVRLIVNPKILKDICPLMQSLLLEHDQTNCVSLFHHAFNTLSGTSFQKQIWDFVFKTDSPEDQTHLRLRLT